MARKKKFSNNWKKWKAKISKLYQHIANVRKDFAHKASDRISKSHAVVVEGLQVKNLSKSAKKNVKAKARLEPRHSGRSAVRVAPPVGVQGVVAGRIVAPTAAMYQPRTARHKRKFVCVECGFSANADFVAACNIREAGLALLACAYPSGDVSPSWQEPTEGIPA